MVVRKSLALPDPSTVNTKGYSFTLKSYTKATLIDLLKQIKARGDFERKTKNELIVLLLDKLTARQMYDILRCNGNDRIRTASGKDVFKLILTTSEPINASKTYRPTYPSYCSFPIQTPNSPVQSPKSPVHSPPRFSPVQSPVRSPKSPLRFSPVQSPKSPVQSRKSSKKTRRSTLQSPTSSTKVYTRRSTLQSPTKPSSLTRLRRHPPHIPIIVPMQKSSHPPRIPIIHPKVKVALKPPSPVRQTKSKLRPPSPVRQTSKVALPRQSSFVERPKLRPPSPVRSARKFPPPTRQASFVTTSIPRSNARKKDHICLACYRYSDLVKLLKTRGYDTPVGSEKQDLVRIITNFFTKEDIVGLLKANGVNAMTSDTLLSLRSKLSGGKFGETCTACELDVLSGKRYQMSLVIP